MSVTPLLAYGRAPYDRARRYSPTSPARADERAHRVASSKHRFRQTSWLLRKKGPPHGADASFSLGQLFGLFGGKGGGATKAWRRSFRSWRWERPAAPETIFFWA